VFSTVYCIWIPDSRIRRSGATPGPHGEAGAAELGQELVPFDPERVAGLDHLDGWSNRGGSVRSRTVSPEASRARPALIGKPIRRGGLLLDRDLPGLTIDRHDVDERAAHVDRDDLRAHIPSVERSVIIARGRRRPA
jgi:hypothetical protein